QLVVEFTEDVQAGAAATPGNYELSNGSNPTSAVLTNGHTVLLSFSSAMSDDTAYTVHVSNVLDLVGNNINSGGANNPAPFRSWMRGLANGLLFESYHSDAGVTVAILTNSASFPNNPYLRTNI